jgi:hypothetical protein
MTFFIIVVHQFRFYWKILGDCGYVAGATWLGSISQFSIYNISIEDCRCSVPYIADSGQSDYHEEL